jgi:hypothetical protein
VKRLEGLLEQRKVRATLIEDDRARDHCVLRLSTVRRPGKVAFLEYENQGEEPRLAGLVVVPAGEAALGEIASRWHHTLELAGSRIDDPEKITGWIESVFLAG